MSLISNSDAATNAPLVTNYSTTTQSGTTLKVIHQPVPPPPKQKNTIVDWVVIVIIVIAVVILIIILFVVIKPELFKPTSPPVYNPLTNPLGCPTSPPPTNVTASQTPNVKPNISLTWNAVLTPTTPGQTILGYNIYLGLSPGIAPSNTGATYTPVALKTMFVTSNGAPITANTTYYIRVATVDTCGSGALSSPEVSFTTAP
jgi:hypothetical protein